MVWEVEDRSDKGQAEEEEDDGVCFAISYFLRSLVLQERGIRTEGKFLIGRKHVHGKGRLNLQLLLGQP